MVLRNIHTVVIFQLLSIVMRVLLILSLIALATSGVIRSNCSPGCPFVWRPVCAWDENGQERISANEECLDFTNCRRRNEGLPEWTKIGGRCKKLIESKEH